MKSISVILRQLSNPPFYYKGQLNGIEADSKALDESVEQIKATNIYRFALSSSISP